MSCFVCHAESCQTCFSESERRDGPRYVEAIRGARAMREAACFRNGAPARLLAPNDPRWSFAESRRFTRPSEMRAGLPEGWIGR